MLYFIPAWYQKNMWRESEQAWHARRMHTEFDDTVKQVQLFNRSGMTDYKILLLSFTPNFRHFLHRQGVFHAPYWSCFDSIQEITKKKAAVFSFHNLSWPEGIEFVYTPFVVVAYLHGKKYAQIEFGEAGNMIEVSMFSDDVITRKNIYDDRGFVSMTVVYKNGEAFYTDYLMENGHTKMRVFAENGHVEINARANSYLVYNGDECTSHTFEKLHYDDISEVIMEVLESHLNANDGDDIFCIAMHELNTIAAEHIIKNKKCILSFYSDRYTLRDSVGKALVDKAGYIITDSEAASRYLRRDYGKEIKKITDITPYDSRMDFGISQQLTQQKILVPVDDLPEERAMELMVVLAEYLMTNENAMVHIFTRNAEYNLPQKILAQIAATLEKAGYDKKMAIPADKNKAENSVDEMDEEEVPVRFFVEQCVDELSVSKCIREQRIMIDMRHNPDLYLQINCISTAIPQIIRRETQYMHSGENGMVVRNIKDIPNALDYFLGTMSNWNKAKVYSYELAQQFTTKKLVEKWKMVMEELKQ